jgi:hypothetical protein
MKKGGIWHDSPISDFRALVDHRWATIVDTFKYKVVGGCSDDVIYYGQEFDRLLIAAANYWELTHSTKPVWIERRGENETNISYALVHGFKLPADADPYKQPFVGFMRSIQSKMTIAIEHGPWLDNKPGEGSATPAGAMMCNNHLSNPSFEDWTGGVPDDWSNLSAATIIENTDLTYIKTGGNSVGFNNSSGAYRGVVSTFLGVGEVYYQISVDVYIVSGIAVLAAYETGFPIPDGVWVQSSGTGWQTLRLYTVGYPVNALNVMVGTHTTSGGEVYFDDIEACRYHGSADWYIESAVPTEQADDATVDCGAYLPPDCSSGYGVGSISRTYLYMGSDQTGSDAHHSGVRFRSVDIPAGANIRNAFVRFSYDVQSPEDPQTAIVTISGEDNVAPAAFSTPADFNGRAQTSRTVPWTPAIDYADNRIFDSPDVSPIIQELVNKTGWASGNDLVLFFLNNGSPYGGNIQVASYDGADPEPKLYIVYSLDTVDGEKPLDEATDQVFVANKMNQANLTHIFKWTGSFSENLLDAVDDWDIHGGTAGHYTAFGITDAFVNDGPFNSLVFNLKDYSDDNGGVNDIVWEYWNGATWATLTLMTDWTDDGTNGPFSNTDLGVLSVHWEPPSAWQTYVAGVNGVSGWWVRARVNSVSGAYADIAQQDVSDRVYSVTWPFIEVKDRNIGGDISALAELVFTNKTDDGTPFDHAYQRFVMGLRDLNRGEEFNGYINFSDVQQPPHIIVTVPDADTAFASRNVAPTTRVAAYTPGSSQALSGDRAIITIASTHAPQYFGRFRIYMRVHVTSSVVVYNQLAINYGDTSAQVDVGFPAQDFYIVDFGELSIPFGSFSSSDLYGDLTLSIGLGAAAATTYRLYDLILMPIDQAVYDFQAQSAADLMGDHNTYGWTQLNADSVRNPKRNLRSLLQKQVDDTVVLNWMHSANKSLLLNENKSQRFWTLGWDSSVSSPVSGGAQGCGTAKLNHVQRYTGMRGKR